jgi:endonuclease YncB( thermonuclease family)
MPASGCASPSKPAGLAAATVERVSDGDTVTLAAFPMTAANGPAYCIDAPEDNVEARGRYAGCWPTSG